VIWFIYGKEYLSTGCTNVTQL